MAMDPAAISAKPATTTNRDAAIAPDSPAARAKGTVRPSAMPITMSRTTADDSKCFSTCGVTGMQLLSQIFARVGIRRFGDLFGRSLGDDLPAAPAAFRPQIDDPIR